jgi:hypothetical protein
MIRSVAKTSVRGSMFFQSCLRSGRRRCAGGARLTHQRNAM